MHSASLVCCRGSPDFEEGEIRAVDLDMKRNHAAHWSLNLALYEALHGQTPQALLALQAAQKTAEGSLHVRPPLCNAAHALLLLCVV